MTAAFVASGACTLLCAIGLSHVLKHGRGRLALPLLIGVYGLGLIIAGIFPAPACCGFPAGTPQDQLPVMTPSAIAHSIGFMVAFTALIAACFVAARRLSGGASLLSLLAGIFMPLLIVLGMTNVIAPGIAFFLAAIIGWAWLAGLVMHIANQSISLAEPAMAAQS
jgi:hypothetical protein